MANEKMVEEWELEQRITSERAEAAYFAVPEHNHKHFELTQTVYQALLAERDQLKDQIQRLQTALDLATSRSTKRKEQVAAFFLGCASSLIVSVLWSQLTKLLVFLQ
jgi:molecular chaperone GrpE (heat shock protein)